MVALRTRFITMIVLLTTWCPYAAAASNGSGRFHLPVSVALLPTDELHREKAGDALVPHGALDRALRWIELRDLKLTKSTTEVDLFLDTADTFLDEHRLLDAALIAEGMLDRSQRDACLQKFDEAFRELQSSLDEAVDKEKQAGLLLDAIHRKLFFGGYRVDCTRLSEVLAVGQFNCVSATIAFCEYATELGLETVAIEVPGHVLCGLSVGGRRIEVETTCGHWLLTANREALRAGFIPPTGSTSELEADSLGMLKGGRSTSALASKPGPLAWRQEMPVSALVAIVYYNRGLDELARGEYEAAAVSNVNALRINPHSPAAWSNLLATINNWALAANRQGNFSLATTLLREGIELAPNHALFQSNLEIVSRLWEKSKP